MMFENFFKGLQAQKILLQRRKWASAYGFPWATENIEALFLYDIATR